MKVAERRCRIRRHRPGIPELPHHAMSDHTSHPSISIVTPTLDVADTLERCLESVWAAQKDAGVIEHIVQDGGSTDGTREILEAWQARTDGFLKPAFEVDTGIADAFNRGIRRARGGWIGILNADDWYDPAAFRHLASYLQRTFTILHGQLRQHAADGGSRVVGKRNYDPKRHFRPLTQMPAQHPTCFVSRDVYDRVGLFDTDYRIAMDYDFLLRAHLAGVEFVYVPEVITNFSRGGRSAEDPVLAVQEMRQSRMRHTGHKLAPWVWYLGKRWRLATRRSG